MKREEELTVSVKQLEWGYYDSGAAYAYTSVGLAYFAYPDGSWCMRNGEKVRVGEDLHAAQSAAQADHEARILSALLATPKPEAEPVAWRYSFDEGVTWYYSGEIGQHRFAGPDIVQPLYAHPTKPEAEPVAWESITSGYIKFVSDERYRKFSSKVRAWYKPYRCSSCTTTEATEGISDGNNVPDYIVQASLDKARQVLEATEGGAHEISAIDALIIGSYVNDAAHNLLVKHTGMEGGCPRIDWYKLRNEIAAALETAIDDFRDARAALTAKPEQTEHVDTDVLENSASLNTSKTDGSGE